MLKMQATALVEVVDMVLHYLQSQLEQ